ncbi:MAG: hypothetical protein GC178_04265 [Flavobacteriales bacterium]|nr:hypothetical protein [Flavobacteriales bacterium]
MSVAVQMRGFKKVFSAFWVMAILVITAYTNTSASHIKSGDITWECLGNGSFIFRVRLFRDCTQQPVNTANQNLNVSNYPGGLTIPLHLASGYPIDRTDPSCGVSCSSPGTGELTAEEWLFESDPVTLTGTPPANGYQFSYNLCCRGTVDNIVNSSNVNQYYVATMYPYNGNDLSNCYDSSPQFAELPTTALCSGYEMRYNNNAVDPDLDSLSYQLVQALGDQGVPVTYESGYSATSPLPGPNPITIDPTTGQIEYASSASVTGKWTVVIAVDGWRCGQRISRIIREMNVTIVPCSGNNPVQVAAPVWSAPAGASGFSVSVQAGDPVSFTLTATDNDLINGVPQTIDFTAAGSQFDASVTGQPNSCVAPCATLSNVSPPYSGTGSVSTTFDWQTTCDHVGIFDDCGKLTNTYNFLFTYKDNFCPARAITTVNVAVTVIGEPIIESPTLHCASTDANGNITLSWEPVVDNNVPQSFVEYVIYHSTSPNGPFQEIGTVSNISSGTYVHDGTNATPPTTSGPNYYYIRTRSGCNDSVLEAPVDTISSIYLTLNNTGTTAELSWTPVATPPLASSNGNGQGLYKLYREYPTNTWSEVTTTFNLSYTDPVIWCNEQVNYRVELTDNLPCTSVSNVVGDVLNNPATPDPQPIDSVTVDPVTGLVTICWPPNTSLNVVEYNVYWNPNHFTWNPLTTVQGYNTTCWTDPNPAAQNGPVWYQVTATNNCNEEGLPYGSGVDQTDYHETMWLQGNYVHCEKTVELQWNPYRYWPEGVKQYEIYASLDGQPEVKVGIVPDTVRTFTHTNLQESSKYCYYVRAVKNAPTRITSTSSDTCFVIYVPKRPDYQYNYNTTVQAGNTGVEDYIFIDSTSGYKGLEIQRGLDPESMKYLWFIPFDPATRYYQYTDVGARPEYHSYYYQIIGVDSCQLYADTMNMSRTIYVEAVANADRTNDLQWNEYEGWIGGVTSYNIYRQIGGLGGPFDYLTTVPSSQLTYKDSVVEIITGDGNFCYYIEAVQGVGASVGPVVAPPDPVVFMETSRSNEACAHQTPNVFIPNAFMPEGVNNIFKPVTVYVDYESYLFQVYNRWGGKIFETTDPEQGWNGDKADQGAYAYYIRFVSASGESYSKRGTVTLIR